MSLLEVLVASIIVAIVVLGLALGLSEGLAYIAAYGDDRIALYLAQQKIEQLRSRGFSALQVGPATTVDRCVPITSLPITSSDATAAPGEPCYSEAPPAQPPYIFSTTVSGGAFTWSLVRQFPRYTRTTVVECVDPENFESSAIDPCPPVEVAKRITVTVTPEMAKSRQVVVQAVMARH